MTVNLWHAIPARLGVFSRSVSGCSGSWSSRIRSSVVDSLNEARIEARDQDRDRDEAVRTLYIETDAEIERECCDSNCHCDAALALMSLRNGENAEIIRLNRIVEALDRRITELEVADMPPLEPLHEQDSNPNWVYDETATSPYAWECTQFN